MAIYPAIYTYKAMRDGLRPATMMRWLKFAVLALAYGVLFMTIATFTALYSMVTL